MHDLHRGEIKYIPDSINNFEQISRSIFIGYKQLANILDPALYSTFSKYIIEHETSDNKKSPLVPSFSSLLAELFDISDKQIIYQVGLIAMLFDHFTHLVDDATDEQKENTPLQIHLSNELLIKGLHYSKDITRDFSRFHSNWEKYMDYAYIGERYLWRHHNNLVSFEQEDYKMLAKRGSLVKTSAALYADLNKKWDILSEIELALDELSIAIQLIDDIIDWELDLSNKIYNLPIILATQHIKTNPQKLMKDNLEKLIYSDKVMMPLLIIISNHFNNGIKIISKHNAPHLLYTLNKINKEIIYLMDIFTSTQMNKNEEKNEIIKIELINRTFNPLMQH